MRWKQKVVCSIVKFIAASDLKLNFFLQKSTCLLLVYDLRTFCCWLLWIIGKQFSHKVKNQFKKRSLERNLDLFHNFPIKSFSRPELSLEVYFFTLSIFHFVYFLLCYFSTSSFLFSLCPTLEQTHLTLRWQLYALKIISFPNFIKLEKAAENSWIFNCSKLDISASFI